jgi:hypothetical protein
MIKSDGIIVILSYPDTFVRPASWEFSSKLWPYIGVGNKEGVQAGHAALLLIKKNTSEINYFDFGRYITSYGYGRVRSKETDTELKVPVKAVFENNKLVNLEEIIIWVENHPEKTHGKGRLITSINNEINHEKAANFIGKLIKLKEIPYGAFVKNGSNCARFVTDTITNSCHQKKIKLKLKSSNLFTPSPIGNVIKGNTTDIIYNVSEGKIKEYINRSILKEYKACFFTKLDIAQSLINTEIPNKDLFHPEKATWLGGIGSGAWFKIEEKTSSKTYLISRFTASGEKDFSSEFELELKKVAFDFEHEYQFQHPTNCSEAFIIQKGETYNLKNSNN